MKKIDGLFILIFIIIITILAIPVTRVFIETASSNSPYLMGFIKTAILATMGEMLASRLISKNYFSKDGLIYRFIIWGLLGMAFVLVFKIFDQGVRASIDSGLLPKLNQDGFLNNLYIAFITSMFMNLIFAPTFMLLHRVTDTYIEIGKGRFKQIRKVKISKVIDSIDFKNFITFVVFKTIPCFWIPAHTITFLLPENYRILSAGFLSIALGLILTLAKKRRNTNEELSTGIVV